MTTILIYLLGCYLMNSHQFLAKALVKGQADASFNLGRQLLNLVWPVVVVGMILAHGYFLLTLKQVGFLLQERRGAGSGCIQMVSHVGQINRQELSTNG